ncbi:hypothetical protein V1J52_11505 [Streptomyces sp. TRM 70351]|uniref:hypothetical protein n=1 Tax=Streptomyces sp. TRM 70351 TaxID=3116552 RepID=UPI002E7ABED3|nr:hypothetical protein [Streptomyces sp. TRM 70351]MEE1928806.1 hypothetical protein [Streptomyces sp. TRM 70351]
MLEHEDGWVGHVQLVTRRPASDIDKAAAAIEDAFDLLVGSVVVDSGGSGAEIWAYQRSSAARHHRRRPMSVRQRGQRDDDGLFEDVASGIGMKPRRPGGQGCGPSRRYGWSCTAKPWVSGWCGPTPSSRRGGT